MIMAFNGFERIVLNIGYKCPRVEGNLSPPTIYSCNFTHHASCVTPRHLLRSFFVVALYITSVKLKHNLARGAVNSHLDPLEL